MFRIPTDHKLIIEELALCLGYLISLISDKNELIVTVIKRDTSMLVRQYLSENLEKFQDRLGKES